MTADTVMAIIVGHLVGDYMLQNDWMAKNKALRTWYGAYVCLTHAVVYGAAVATCLWLACGLSWFVGMGAAIVTHYPIDRWCLGKRWMQFYGQTLDGPFAPCVYIGVDNGAHLLLMWLIIRGIV